MHPHLLALQCLAVRAKVDCRLSTICHNFLSPAYLSNLLIVYTSSRELRSSADTQILRIHHVRNETLTIAVSPAVLQSSGTLFLLTYVTFNPSRPSKLH